MKDFNLKQKKIILIILLVIALFIYYYFYTKNNTEEINNENLEITNTEKIDEKKKEEEKIIIHITGAVNKEGIVELETNSRIADAIEKAGGAKENADLKNINLATILEDGMKIHIPTIEETEANKNTEIENNNFQAITETTDNLLNTEKTKEKININTATKEELDTLPGIGPSIASKIINYRQENGKFKNIEELKEVSGIGEAKYEKIKDLITIK